MNAPTHPNREAYRGEKLNYDLQSALAVVIASHLIPLARFAFAERPGFLFPGSGNSKIDFRPSLFARPQDYRCGAAGLICERPISSRF